MKDREHCSSQVVASGCQPNNGIQMVQLFPNNGILARNIGLPLPKIKTTLGGRQGIAYSYIVRSVKFNRETTRFEQHGSGPNFQGGCLTLCTCKHRMRASRSADSWSGSWIIGVTSRTIHDGKHWLCFLAKIQSAYESHSDLWNDLDANTRNAKAAHKHYLGDVYRPKRPRLQGDVRFSSDHYVEPSYHTHHNPKNPMGWKNDIEYRKASRFGYASLLVADPSHTFVWDKPLIVFVGDHCRDFHKWLRLTELLDRLRGNG